MIRDLQYPEDAKKELEALIKGLEYDAAFAILGNSMRNVPQTSKKPDFSTGVRFGGKDADDAVRRDSVGLCSRFSLISMVSRFEKFIRGLLLQRRVLEELKTEGVKMTPPKLWAILKKISRDLRQFSVAQVTLKLLVTNPSAELLARSDWLTGINRVRNCLAHRLGIVQIDDVKKPGTPLEDGRDTDTLKVKWLRLKPMVDGQEIKSFPYKGSGDGKSEIKMDILFEEYERDWRIGDVIHLTPLECQNIAISLALLGKRILDEFEIEMNSFLSKYKTRLKSGR